jgi:hypothetical protein
MNKEELKKEDKQLDLDKFERMHTTLKELIKHIVQYDKLARKDYVHLCWRVWILSNQVQIISPMKDYSKIYKPDSITRIYRELIRAAKRGEPELQYLLNDEETLNKRNNLENLNHNYYQEKNLTNQALIIK